MKEASFWKKNKKIIIISVIIVFLLLIFFGAKIALFVNFLLGNDILLKLSVDKEFLTLEHGQSEIVTFEASVTTNPFCRASCISSFENLGLGKTLDQSEFTLRTGIPTKKEFAINATKRGKGQELYRFNLECSSTNTFWCHTSPEPTTRNILVTIDYDLNEQEKNLQEQWKQNLTDLWFEVNNFKNKIDILSRAVNDINPYLFFYQESKDLDQVKISLNITEQNIQKCYDLWKNYDFEKLSQQRKLLNLEKLSGRINQVDRSLRSSTQEYNDLIRELKEAQEQVNEADKISIIFNLPAINSTVLEQLNNTFILIEQRSNLQDKSNFVYSFINSSSLHYIKDYLIAEPLRKTLQADLAADALCSVTGKCIIHPLIKERAINVSSSDTCSEIDGIKSAYDSLKNKMDERFDQENYNLTEEFNSNLSAMMENIINNWNQQYLASLSPNASNSKLIKEMIIVKEKVSVAEYPQYNLTPAIFRELNKFVPPACENYTVPSVNIKSLNAPEMKFEENISTNITFSLEEAQPQCCVWGKCHDCCSNNECGNDNSTFPIVFLHGHAVNKDLAAEYSLEGFNQIQKRMEKEGYINAGAITLYTTKNIPYGEWGKMGVPLTIRASYYFDVLEQPDNYVVIPTKSENIDNYAIKLKDLVETIKYKTGKPQVDLVAFSMGGLVSRRYIQLFEADNSVHKLILIGTPNLGIVGDIAKFCPLIGEQKECQDMQADSLFMNKLNRGKLPAVPFYNIVGTGCVMSGGLGDGAVLLERAQLNGTKNFIINGTCRSSVEPLHLDLRNLDIYPQVYDILMKALRE